MKKGGTSSLHAYWAPHGKTGFPPTTVSLETANSPWRLLFSKEGASVPQTPPGGRGLLLKGPGFQAFPICLGLSMLIMCSLASPPWRTVRKVRDPCSGGWTVVVLELFPWTKGDQEDAAPG